MVGRPLPQDLRIEARVDDLFRGGARKVVGRDVTHAIATGLDGVEISLRQHRKNVRRIREPGPVELDVLAGREMSVSTIVIARDMGKLAHLRRAQNAVG